MLWHLSQPKPLKNFKIGITKSGIYILNNEKFDIREVKIGLQLRNELRKGTKNEPDTLIRSNFNLGNVFLKKSDTTFVRFTEFSNSRGFYPKDLKQIRLFFSGKYGDQENPNHWQFSKSFE